MIGSELLLVETLVKPVEPGDPALEASFRRFLTASREMQLLPISRQILERALKLRATHRVRTPDAIHAATALIAGCTLFATNDPVFRRVSGLQAVILDDYV
ncbi:MAG TPA: PIN domain-containing protein [Planctomycetota bacterium]|nr:PIN domain-containing protein [Planctomycetota bacterium]